MSHIFISYNRSDADFAGLLMMQMEQAGIKSWLDTTRLRLGKDWSQEIDQAISTALALVVVMSPEAKASEYVTYEWSFALGAGLPVIPVLIKETTLHPRLARLHYQDFTFHQRFWPPLIEELVRICASGKATFPIPPDTPAYLRQAIMALDSPNPDDREGAIHSLSTTNHPTAESALVGALNHPMRDVRFGAALTRGKQGDERATSVLIESAPDTLSDDPYDTTGD